jgi:tetratricopeptide (TPR) repeat protein
VNDEAARWRAHRHNTAIRHITRYLARAEEHSQTSQVDFDALEEEQANILTAMDRAYQDGQWLSVLSFMDALKQYLHLQGHWGEAARCVRYALDAAEHLGAVQAQANWTFYAGLIQSEQGNYEEAETHYRQSLDLARAEGQVGLQAEVLRRLGWLAQTREERRTAEERYRQAIALHRQVSDRQGQARDWRHLGLLSMQSGNFDQARQYIQSSLDLVEGADDWKTQQLQSHIQLDLGRIALQQGQLDEAQQHLDCALAHVEVAPDRLLRADILFHRAMLAEKRGNLCQAASQYQERLKLAREAGDRQGQVSALLALGNLAFQKRDYDRAQQCYEAVWQAGDRRDQAAAKMQLGSLAYSQGDHARATDHLQEALQAFSELDRRQEIAGCHQQLGLVAQARRQWQAAERHYQASLEIRRELDLRHDAAQSIYMLGRLAQEQGKVARAQEYYQQALEMGERDDFPNLPMIRQALDSLRLREVKGDKK